MNKIAVVTDSDTNISVEEGKKLGIYIMSKPLSCGNKEIIDGITLTYDEFLKELVDGKVYKSSQMPPQIIKELFDELLKTHDNIIYIPISSKMSKAYEFGVQLEKEYDGKVKTIDAKAVAVVEGYEARLAAKLIKDGKSFQEICDILESRGGKGIGYVIPETLLYLKRGGRVTPAAAALGGLLGIKPVLMLKDGAIDKFGTARTLKKAYQMGIEEIIKLKPTPQTHEIYVLHTNEPVAAKEMKALIGSYPELKNFEVKEELIPGVVLCHTGPKTIAICLITKYNER